MYEFKFVGRRSTPVVPSLTADIQSLLRARNFLILQSIQSAQRAIGSVDVSGETIRLSISLSSGVPRGGFGVFNPPPRNSEDIGGVLDRMSKKDRRLDFLL